VSRYENWLNVALEAGDKAGKLLRGRWRQAHTVHHKGFRDIVTEADLECETLIIEHLRKAFPDHAVTSEEAGAEISDAKVHWFVDPLDGTTNFSRNNPNFSTSIAAVEDGWPVVGVVVDPLREHVFAAWRGGGATLNGTPIHVSGVDAIAEAIFAVDSPREPQLRDAMWQRLGVLLRYGRTMRASGSAALNIAYVAVGWIDLYMHLSLKPWDQTAAALFVEEAGGALSTIAGAPWTPFSPDPLIASSAALLDAFHNLMSQAGL